MALLTLRSRSCLSMQACVYMPMKSGQHRHGHCSGATRLFHLSMARRRLPLEKDNMYDRHDGSEKELEDLSRYSNK